MVIIGIIGGSGLDDPQILENVKEQEVNTPYGRPSSTLTKGTIAGAQVVMLARHGKTHDIAPSAVNFRANIHALKEAGCTHIFAATAVGSLRAEIKPGNIVFPNQCLDFTKQRKMSFFDEKVVHTPMAEPFNKELRETLVKAAKDLDLEYNTDVTVVTVEGPRFSTKAESHMFRNWGADIINMSTCPEVFLANEANIPYQSVAMSTDYDCWKEDEESVTFEMILERMKENAEKVKKLFIQTIQTLGGETNAN